MIIDAVEKPFLTPTPDPDMYSDLATRPFNFFPNHPVTMGMGTYKSDKRRNTEEEPCRKESQRHKILLPGLFTAFCPHEICLGFSLMLDPESPKTAFISSLRLVNNPALRVAFISSLRLVNNPALREAFVSSLRSSFDQALL